MQGRLKQREIAHCVSSKQCGYVNCCLPETELILLYPQGYDMSLLRPAVESLQE
jgi:hypothetical protein